MVYPETFTGFQVDAADLWPPKFIKREVSTACIHLTFKSNLKFKFIPKPFGAFDVDVKIQACGICGSDIHSLSGGWGPMNWPLCCGHEIVGTTLRIGPKVTLVKAGSRVGVGAQIYSCLDCKQCKNDNETYCRHQIDTYGAIWPDTGIVSQGGYASHIRAHEVC
jgi:alcohol dehydrogenase (NADP+)